MRQITEIIIHCTATPKGREVTVEDINRWHKQRGWAMIGYHYVIYLDGSIHQGRPVEQVGAHCEGHNLHAIGVCYVGGLSKDGHHAEDTRTPEQKEGLKKLLRHLLEKYHTATLYGHNELKPTGCPGFSVPEEYGRNGEKL